MKQFLYLLAIPIFSISTLFSINEDDVKWEKEIKWEENRIDIKIETPLDNKDSTLAASRRKAENWITDNKTNIFFKNIIDIKINSVENVSDIINENPEIYYKLDKLGEDIEIKQSDLSTNLESFKITYSFPIYPDFVSVFYNQDQYLKKLKKLDHREYGEFTGLIIYIPEDLPLHGKKENGKLTKVLFPRIFNEDMNLIIDYTMVKPEFIKKWGLAIYGESFDENLYQSRIGVAPLRVIAKEIFGINNSDIIISNEDAEKLIGSEENLKIISQSRILLLN